MIAKKLTFLAPGLNIAGEQRHATVTLIPNRTTFTVVWDLGGIDKSGLAARAFSERLVVAGLPQALTKCWNDHCGTLGSNARYTGGECCGEMRSIPKPMAEAVAKMILEYFTDAAFGLPASDEELEEQLRGKMPLRFVERGEQACYLGEQQLACPFCGDVYVRLLDAVAILQAGPQGARSNVDGNVIALQGWCERHHHRFNILLGFHKGMTATWAERLPDAVPDIEAAADLLAEGASNEPDLPPAAFLEVKPLGSLKPKKKKPGNVVINPGNNTATLNYAYPYEIDLALIKDERDLLAWLLHLSRKNWMDTDRLHQVAIVIGGHLGFNLDLH